MRKNHLIALASLAALGGLGCHTITEDLPTRPTAASQFATLPLPVIVTPVQLPVPTAPAPAPAPVPNPNPNPAPNPPPPGPSNGSTVVKVGVKVYFVECDGVPVPGSENATTAALGCRIHMDATPKDASNKPTTARGRPEWTYSDPSLISVSGKDDYTPTLQTRARGSLSIYVEVDDVRSNTVSIRII